MTFSTHENIHPNFVCWPSSFSRIAWHASNLLASSSIARKEARKASDIHRGLGVEIIVAASRVAMKGISVMKGILVSALTSELRTQDCVAWRGRLAAADVDDFARVTLRRSSYLMLHRYGWSMREHRCITKYEFLRTVAGIYHVLELVSSKLNIDLSYAPQRVFDHEVTQRASACGRAPSRKAISLRPRTHLQEIQPVSG
jgi:hypothetical protein